MRWCTRCILPDTRPNLVLDDEGVCNACRSHAAKPEVDWAMRERMFSRLAQDVRSREVAYHCVIPVSGGKDSTWQVAVALEHGLRPLAVTWRPPGRTALGQRNLDNLIELGVDHIDFSISPVVERRFTLAAMERVGDPAVPMHMAIHAIPLTVALRFEVPLVIWGENSAAEYGTTDDALAGHSLDDDWFRTFGVTQGTTVDDWVSDGLPASSLTPYRMPDRDRLAAQDIRAIFLGWYFEWDPERTRDIAVSHGFSFHAEGARTGAYDYADIDDDFISVHHWLKWYKFGFTRTFDNLSLEIRNGRMTRDEAVTEIVRRGAETPRDDIGSMCDWLGIPTSHFFDLADRWRNTDIWQRGDDGTWRIDGFLTEDWIWE